MSHLVWSFEDLVRFTRSEDPEVRSWAVNRLIRHHAGECCDAIAPFLLDDHEATPTMVARHLGERGGAVHHAMLIRGFRVLRGVTPGFCLQALARTGYAGIVELAADSLKRGDLTDPALALIVETLAEMGTEASKELVREHIERRVELLVEPAALRGAMRVVETAEIPDLLARLLPALERGGTHRAAEAFRTLMDDLCIDDAGWCFRTGPSGHIELRKTIKAVDSGYDSDILSAMGESTIKHIAQRFRAGNLSDIVRSLADWTCAETQRLPTEPGDELPVRIAAAVGALAAQPFLERGVPLGQQFQQWLLGFHLSAAFAVARGQNTPLALKHARGELDRLLALAEIETAHLRTELSAAIAVVCREDERVAREAQDWCLRMLEAQGPFFPKLIALEALGELRAIHFIPEVIEYLADENSYVYGAAERALSKIGEAIIPSAVARIEAGDLEPDAAQSILVLLCDLGTGAASEAVMRHLDWFMDVVGPGTTAEWVSLFGTEELIEPLRDWLEEDPALVGQGLLLLGAIHDVPIPEEEEILREDERARQADHGEDAAGGDDEEGGSYVM
jgi:HEAT repeat protein